MERPRLRIYYGPGDAKEVGLPKTEPKNERVTVRFGEVCHWLFEARQDGRAWFHDFADDEITISADLHDVFMAYQQFRRPTA